MQKYFDKEPIVAEKVIYNSINLHQYNFTEITDRNIHEYLVSLTSLLQEALDTDQKPLGEFSSMCYSQYFQGIRHAYRQVKSIPYKKFMLCTIDKEVLGSTF